MIRLLVTGLNGQVARALLDRAGAFPHITVVAVGRPQFDLENIDTVFPILEAAKADVIVNAAAYTAVDNAETEPRRAFAINCDGAASVAAAARILKKPFIHLSTDYVFAGDKGIAYSERDAPAPLGVYGKSKLAGELAVRLANPDAVILRTSWIYSPFGSNFVKTMIRLADERSELRVVDDQCGNPTSALDLAEAILHIIPRLEAGTGSTFHVAGGGFTSWYGLAKKVIETSQILGGPFANLVPIPTSEYPTLARRPANSQLDTTAFYSCFGYSLRHWCNGIEDTVFRIIMGQKQSTSLLP